MAVFWSFSALLTFLILARGLALPSQVVLKENDFEITVGSNREHAPPIYSTESSMGDWRQKSKILNFDDIDHGPAAKPMGNISTYEGLDFSGFQVFDADHAAYEGLISIDDINCATSPHNAILGSRATRSTWPRFVVENWNETSTYFKLRGISIKPVGSIPPYISILITGWEVVDGHAVNSTFLGITFLRAGHQPVLRIDLTRFTSWEAKINMVEAYASAPDGKDWPFCMDDIQIDLFKNSSDE